MPFDYLKEKYRRRQVRRTPTGDNFACADSIDFMVTEHWDLCAKAGGVFFRRAYLRCLEQNPPEGLEFRYALVYRKGQPIAAVVIQILERDLSCFLPQDSPLAAGGRLISQKLFVCGSLLCWGNQGVSVAPGVDWNTVWPSVAEVLYRIRRAEKLSGSSDFVLFRELPTGDKPAMRLRDYGYRPVDVEPDMVMETRGWTTYQDYLSSLQSKYRGAAKNVFKKIEKAGCKVHRLQGLSRYRERIYQLYDAVWEKAEVRPVKLTPDYFCALEDALGDDYVLIGVTREEQLLGYVTVIRSEELAVGYMLGFDREAAEELPLYLRLLNAVVEQAIEWGCQRISLGGTALDPKARLGGAPSPRQVWVRHRLAPLNVIVGPMLQTFDPQQPPDRNPFKE